MLGIDVSKQTLFCTLLHPADKRVLGQREVPNSPEGIGSLLERVPSTTPWGLEPTGRYSLQVAQPAQQAGRSVWLAPSKRAKRFHESLPDRAKTDRLDSRSLALFALSQPLPTSPIKSETVQQLDQLLAARTALALSITRLSQQAQQLPSAAPALQEAVSALKTQREQLDAQIARLTAEKDAYPHVERLQAVPGMSVRRATSVSRGDL